MVRENYTDESRLGGRRENENKMQSEGKEERKGG